MLVVEREEDIEAAKAANPNDKVIWYRPDGSIEVHHAHGKGSKIYRPYVRNPKMGP